MAVYRERKKERKMDASFCFESFIKIIKDQSSNNKSSRYLIEHVNTMLNSVGAITHSCLTPFVTSPLLACHHEIATPLL